MQYCPRCQQDLPLADFPPSRRGVRGHPCRSCHTAYVRAKRRADPHTYNERTLAWREANRERDRATRRAWRANNLDSEREATLRRQYGITLSDVRGMLATQDSKCAGCCTALTIKTAHVDHCHLTNAVRGLLCRKCNTGMGLLCDDPLILRRLVSYLERAE